MSKKTLWTGRVLMGFSALFLAFDGIIHAFRVPFAVDALVQLGYPSSVSTYLGVALLVGVILYVYPRTSILGAIYLTGYLGGAIATNVRIGAPLFGYVLFPVYVAIVLWLGLYLLEPRLKTLLPLKK